MIALNAIASNLITENYYLTAADIINGGTAITLGGQYAELIARGFFVYPVMIAGYNRLDADLTTVRFTNQIDLTSSFTIVSQRHFFTYMLLFGLPSGFAGDTFDNMQPLTFNYTFSGFTGSLQFTVLYFYFAPRQ